MENRRATCSEMIMMDPLRGADAKRGDEARIGGTIASARSGLDIPKNQVNLLQKGHAVYRAARSS